MKEIGLALAAGFIVGAVFAIFRLPIPAPPALAGIAGIVGIYLGFKFIAWVAPMVASVFN
ncbi:XapX domain-containing protein [Halobacillus sp. A5]|uniref:XapX domain-containing protein n=1 Tax=Halobacillus sp. A5 TaxID=2880263 RepID=UPI0020A66303|nr:XapX domain-containing protein [Halobacillus sp. A5]MCP3027539.1 XapX domain-containing protein [Halobacillus sp. A5]